MCERKPTRICAMPESGNGSEEDPGGEQEGPLCRRRYLARVTGGGQAERHCRQTGGAKVLRQAEGDVSKKTEDQTDHDWRLISRGGKSGWGGTGRSRVGPGTQILWQGEQI